MELNWSWFRGDARETTLEQMWSKFGSRVGAAMEQNCDVIGAVFAVMHAAPIYNIIGADLA